MHSLQFQHNRRPAPILSQPMRQSCWRQSSLTWRWDMFCYPQQSSRHAHWYYQYKWPPVPPAYIKFILIKLSSNNAHIHVATTPHVHQGASLASFRIFHWATTTLETGAWTCVKSLPDESLTWTCSFWRDKDFSWRGAWRGETCLFM